jgi:hypothetical protein
MDYPDKIKIDGERFWSVPCWGIDKNFNLTVDEGIVEVSVRESLRLSLDAGDAVDKQLRSGAFDIVQVAA